MTKTTPKTRVAADQTADAKTEGTTSEVPNDKAAEPGAAATTLEQDKGPDEQDAGANGTAADDVPAEPTVKARVLVDGNYGRANDVAQIPASEVERAKASGQVDFHPDAVAYAESLQS